MWNKGYIIISEITGHKRFLYDYEELITFKKRMTESGFWESYKYLKSIDPNNNEIIRIKRYFQKISTYERDALNTPVQGTAAIITKTAGILFFDAIVKNNWLWTVKIVNQVHDELLIEAPNNIIDDASKILLSCMEKAASYFCKSVKLTAEPIISNCWIH